MQEKIEQLREQLKALQVLNDLMLNGNRDTLDEKLNAVKEIQDKMFDLINLLYTKDENEDYKIEPTFIDDFGNTHPLGVPYLKGNKLYCCYHPLTTQGDMWVCEDCGAKYKAK